MGISSPFNPNSPQALAISNLFWGSLAISAIIFAIVAGLIIYIVLRFRHRGETGEPRQVAGNNRLEITWTAIPALILVGIFIATVPTMRTADPPVRGQQPDLVVVGHQWWWEVRYPKAGVVTANEIHIPTGKQILVRLESADVIHDFWVPELGPKRDMVPGKINHIWIAADNPGKFGGACAEYCGQHHAWMRLLVVAHPQAEFDAWEQRQLRPPAPATGAVEAGARIYQERTCVNCHVIGPTGVAVGPDLTHLAGRETLAAGIVENTPENLAKWIADPQEIKPGSYMPDLQLTEQEVRDLVAYLETLE